jgi:tetratricopeptide (TPR) repeat protein
MKEDPKKVNDTEQVKNYLELAREFQDQNLLQKAEDTLLLALKKIPNHPFLLTKLANFYYATDRSDKALRTLNKLIKNQPNFLFPYYLRAKIYEDQNKNKKAISDYLKALTDSTKDTYVLSRLISLLISSQQAGEALKLIKKYQKLLDDPLLFAEMEAEGLVEMGNKIEAFNKMRSILIKEPENKNLLQKYLKLSIQTSKKSPIELYNMLRKTVPQLRKISSEELTDLEVDYLIYHEKYQDAHNEINIMVQQFPDRYYWRKKNVVLQKRMKNLKNIVDELEILFLYNPRDVSILNIFEDYLFENNLVDRWKSVIRKVKKTGHYNEKFNSHLRDICFQHNLIFESSLNFKNFLKGLRILKLDEVNLKNITYQKLPLYVLQTFIMQISVEDKLPQPDELWALICKEREFDNQEVPFQLEDLKLAYPVWLFALQFLFLFKTFTNFNCIFKPLLLQKDLIALVLDVNGQTIHLDISLLLEENQKKLKSIIKVNKKWLLRWPNDISAEQIVNGIPIYSESQFQEIFGKLKSSIKKT